MKSLKLLLIVIVISMTSLYTYAQTTLPSASAALADQTTNESAAFINVVTTSAISVVSGDKVLVVASYSNRLTENAGVNRNLFFNLTDGTNNSGEVIRTLAANKSTDYGMGSLVHIFSYSSSSSPTFILQHHSSSNKQLTTNGSITAIKLNDGTNVLNSANTITASAANMTSTWSPVSGSTTGSITSPSDGGYYVAATIQSCATVVPAEGQWKLQYSTDNSAWIDMGISINRTIASTGEFGIANLVGALPHNTVAGDYYFRVAHKSLSGTVSTDVAHLVAVSLSYGSGATSGAYPIVVDDPDGSATSGSAMVDASTITITPTQATSVFLNAQINMRGENTIEQPTFDLFVDDVSGGATMYSGLDHFRKITAGSTGSGSLVGITTTLTASTDYYYNVRQASDGTNILTTSNVVLVGFQLSSTAGPSESLPVDLLSFNAKLENYKINLLWSTASEVNNDYYTIEKSFDKENWVNIGELNGAGNSNSIIVYNFIYNKKNKSVLYYRLKQTDFDGKFTYSHIIVVIPQKSEMSIFPNPTNDKITISGVNINKDEIVIFNNLGQDLGSIVGIVSVSNMELVLSLSKLTSGVYFVKTNEKVFKVYKK